MNQPQISELQPGALDRSRTLRLFAIVLWSSFLGAVVLLIAWMAFVGAFWPVATDLAHLSTFFFVAWLLAMVPALSAAMLATPHVEDNDHGR